MAVRVYEGRYKDVRSVVLETDALRVTMLPDWGGKMASLVHKRTGAEHLYQLPEAKFRRVSYGARFDDGECAGFDDMFPTISECYCDLEPWAGAKFPDHGEVWSIPWKAEVSDSEVRLAVHGVRFPYLLSKAVAIERENVVLLSYRVENLSPCDFPAMWAAHPLFSMTPGTRIIVPGAARHIINTVPGPALGGYGERYTFPNARTSDGKEWDLSRINANDGKFSFKYFFLDELEEGFALIHDPKTRETVGLSWSVNEVPYLGMWVNEGGHAGQFNVAPEPCTAPLDRWDTARQWGRLPVIPPLGSREWTLRVSVGLAENPSRVDNDGTIR